MDKVSKLYNLLTIPSTSSGVAKANYPNNLNLWDKIPDKSHSVFLACPEGNIYKLESKTFPPFKVILTEVGIPIKFKNLKILIIKFIKIQKIIN